MAAFRIAVVNNKGGVGKTTTTVNLAVALAQRGKRTLLVDFDPQGNSTDALGLSAHMAETVDVYEAIDLVSSDRPFTPIRNPLKHDSTKLLDLVPTGSRQETLEETLYDVDDRRARARYLDRALARIDNAYDFILVDAPPSLGAITLNAMVAAPNLLIPIRLEPQSIKGTVVTVQRIQKLRETTQPHLSVLGVLGTCYVEREKRPRELFAQFGQLFSATMFETFIHSSAAIKSAPDFGVPITLLKPSDRGAQEYNRVAEEVIARVQP